MGQGYIAIVDDEASVRAALGRLLRLADFEVLGFESGQAFIDSLAQRAPECVLLDVQMPGLSGFDVQQRLRMGHPQMPVIFITAADDDEVERRAVAGGARALLRKPFSSQLLLQAVASALADRR